MNLTLCTLIFGELNPMVQIHLNNLSKAQPTKICIGLSKKSSPLLFEALKIINPKPCLHFIEEDANSSGILSDFPLENEITYSYNHRQFAVINLFKWTFLLNVLDTHSDSEFLLFTDFDVIWLQGIPIFDFLQISQNSGISTQLDKTNSGSLVHCTGIIFMLNRPSNIELISEVFRQQLKHIKNGDYLYYDQVAFNNYVAEFSPSIKVGFLSPENYVIGSSAIKMVFKSRNKMAKDLIAFHANYAVGHRSKFLIMISIRKIFQGYFYYRILLLVISLIWKFYFKVSKLITSIKHD
jgi:hypothetical protein